MQQQIKKKEKKYKKRAEFDKAMMFANLVVSFFIKI